VKYIQNLPHLEDPLTGEPMETNVGTGESPRIEVWSLARWVSFLVGRIPQGKLLSADGEKMLGVLIACRRADKVDGVGVIELEDDYYSWLLKILFDDAEGKRLGLDGAYALNTYGLPSMVVQKSLEQLQIRPEAEMRAIK